MGRVRFSLRNLLVVTTLLSIIFAVWGSQSLAQRARLNTLRAQGYLVQYRPVGKVWTWVGKLIGVDFVSTPYRLSCNGEPTLETVAEVREIEDLILSVSKVSDQDLEHISSLPKLDFLVLNHTDVTDSGIRHLVNLPLISLDLTGLPITDECVTHLAKIKSLRLVHISPNTISAEGQLRLADALPHCKVQVEER